MEPTLVARCNQITTITIFDFFISGVQWCQLYPFSVSEEVKSQLTLVTVITVKSGSKPLGAILHGSTVQCIPWYHRFTPCGPSGVMLSRGDESQTILLCIILLPMPSSCHCQSMAAAIDHKASN